MDFGETLLIAQRNQKQKTSDNAYYRTKFEPPKKEHKPTSKLSANIQKFLAKKEEEERRKQDEARRKRDELLAMRDPKATKKIQKMLKVIKSANKSVLAEAVDREHTAVTRTGAEQPDQDDYGYESQEAAALYRKMMDKYSKLPEEDKFPASKGKLTKKDLDGTRERMKAALQREDEPQPRQRKSKSHHYEKEESPPPQEKKPEKPKVRKPAPPPLDFNQLLKIAEEKKDKPIELPLPAKKTEPEPERLMTKRQKREYEEDLARREARKRRKLEEEAGSSSSERKSDKQRTEIQKKPESTFTRIPKIGEKNNQVKVNKGSDLSKQQSINNKYRNDDRPSSSKSFKQESQRSDRSVEIRSQNTPRLEKSLNNRPQVSNSRENDKFKSSRDDREKREDDRKKISKPDNRVNVNRDQERSDRSKQQSVDRNRAMKEQERNKVSKEIPKTSRPEIRVKSQEEWRQNGNSHGSQNKHLLKQDAIRKQEQRDRMLSKEKAHSGSPKLNGPSKANPNKISEQKPRDIPKQKPAPSDRRPQPSDKGKTSSSKPVAESFDFDKHVNSLKKAPVSRNMGPSGRPGDVRKKYPPGDPRNRAGGPKRRVVESDSEYDSEMDDFIDDAEDDGNYSEVIRDIFGYDKNKYRYLDEEDDYAMESSFAQQQREEYISKKIGIMEDLEDMKLEAMEKKKAKKRRRISDDGD